MLLSYFGSPAEGLDTKSSRTDPVSDADREAERAIRELLAAERPDDGLLAEEGSRSEAASGRCWIVDPLDGTVNFLYGFPVWAVSVALEDADGVAVGVVHDPMRGETFRAARGAGAELDGRRLHGARAPRNCDGARGHRLRLRPGAARRPGRAAGRLLPRYATSAAPAPRRSTSPGWPPGRMDGFFEHGLKPWDWAAGRLIAEEAGASVVELPGDPAGLAAAATPELARRSRTRRRAAPSRARPRGCGAPE